MARWREGELRVRPAGQDSHLHCYVASDLGFVLRMGLILPPGLQEFGRANQGRTQNAQHLSPSSSSARVSNPVLRSLLAIRAHLKNCSLCFGGVVGVSGRN